MAKTTYIRSSPKYYLAVVYTDQKRYVDANELFTEVLDGYKRGYEGDLEHTRITDTLHSLGVLRTKQELYNDANDLLVKAIEGRRRRLD